MDAILMRRLLSILLLLLSASASAQIARVAANCTGTTSCTTTGNAVGDLEIAFAGINASSTKPTNAAWTAVGAGVSLNGSGSADSAAQMFCKVATGTSEASGTFSSTDHVVIMVYSGELSGSTATCASTILGTPSYFNSTVNTTSTTETFNAITSSDSSSWIVGMGYCSACTAGIGTAPTNMANRSSVAGPPSAGGHDTNGTAASFASANVTLTTAGRIITATVEIKAAAVQTPVISPAGGLFGPSQTMTITDGTAGSTICYTTNGTTPTASAGSCTNGTTYSGSFSQSVDATIKAIASKSGLANSAIDTETYTFGVSHAARANGASATATTTAADFSGAVVIAAACSGRTGATGTNVATITDSQGNAYIQRAAVGGGVASGTFNQTSYIVSPSSSSTQTFTCTLTGTASPTAASLVVVGLIAPNYSGFVLDDACAGNTATGGVTTIAACTSNFTPATTNEFLITFASADATTAPLDPNTGFVRLDQQGAGFIASGYLVDSASAPINTTWTLNNNVVQAAASLIAFKPGSCSNSMALMGVGCR